MSNEDWKNIEVDVDTSGAESGHVYIARITNVEDGIQKHGETAYRLTYTVWNNVGHRLEVRKTVQQSHFKDWLSYHSGFNPRDKNTLLNIASQSQLVITDEFNSHVYVARVIPMENLEVD